MNNGVLPGDVRPLHTNARSMHTLLDESDGVQSGTTGWGRRTPMRTMSRQSRIVQEASKVLVRESGGAEEQENRDPQEGSAQREQGPQRRHWVFTSCDAEDPQLLRCIEVGLEAFGSAVRYIVFQKERAETGTIHYQGYVEFKRSYRLKRVRTLVSRNAHFEPRRGSGPEAAAYCKKAESRVEGPWEFGTPSQGQGARSDLCAFKDAIKDGKRRRDLLEEFPTVMGKFPKFYDTCRLAQMEEGWREVECIMLIGETGTGKTRWVYDNWAKEAFWRLPMVTSGLWFDTYDGQTHTLLDDFAGAASKVTLSSLLQILDGYFIKVPIKGGFTWWGPSHIAVTTNLEPKDWYKWEGRRSQYLALARRFTKIMQFFVAEDTFTYTSDEYFHIDDIE